MSNQSQPLFRLYGHTEESEQPLHLREVTISGDPELLRVVASFLVQTAELMERHGTSFGHEHLSDFVAIPEGAPDLIVTKVQQGHPNA